MIWGFFALCFFSGAFARLFDRCPDVETVKDFDISKYLGRWYEAEKYFSASETGASCVVADYSNGENNTILMVNTYKDPLGSKQTAEADARVPDSSEPAKLKIKYRGLPFAREGDYWILGTDYESYALVYSCRNTPFTSMKHAWIITRERNATDSTIAEAMAIAEKNELKKSLFTKTKQTDCEEEEEN